MFKLLLLLNYPALDTCTHCGPIFFLIFSPSWSLELTIIVCLDSLCLRVEVLNRYYVLLNSCNAATMLLAFIHLNSNGIITCLNCSISFLFENGRFFNIHSAPQLYLNIKLLRASCLEYLLDLSKFIN